MSKTLKKRVDSNRTKKAKALAVERREIRSSYKKNGGRF
jgi:hypothetical protein